MTSGAKRFLFRTLTVRITGARAGVLSAFMEKKVHSDDLKVLAQLGEEGWELSGVVAASYGAGGSSSTDAAICFFKKAVDMVAPPARSQDQTHPDKPYLPAASLAGADLGRAVYQKSIGRLALNPSAAIPDDSWTYIAENGIQEALPFIEATPSLLFAKRDLMLMYFANLEWGVATDALYKLLLVEVARAGAADLIRELKLVRHDKIAELLELDDTKLHAAVLPLIGIEKPSYGPQDIPMVSHLIHTMQGRFQPAPIQEKSGILGRKRFWVCRCETENPMDVSICGCGLHRRGYPFNFDFDFVIQNLRDSLDVLQQTFPGN